MYYSTCNVTLSILILLLATLLFPWNFGIQANSIYYSLLQLTTAYKPPTLSPINLRRERTENTSRCLYPLLCDVTAYAEVCLPSRCLETGCITLLFHCCSARTTEKAQPHLLLSVGPCLQSCCLTTRWSNSLQHYSLTQFSSTHVVNCSLWNWYPISSFNVRSSPDWNFCGRRAVRTQFVLQSTSLFLHIATTCLILATVPDTTPHGCSQTTNGRIKLETNWVNRKVCDDLMFWGRYRH
jgi:hypothetical protein